MTIAHLDISRRPLHAGTRCFALRMNSTDSGIENTMEGGSPFGDQFQCKTPIQNKAEGTKSIVWYGADMNATISRVHTYSSSSYRYVP